jgi:hemolysin-activating ACP:hemolysin acyltransferase
MRRLLPMAARCRMRAADGLPVALAAVLRNLLPFQRVMQVLFRRNLDGEPVGLCRWTIASALPIQPYLPERSARLC